MPGFLVMNKFTYLLKLAEFFLSTFFRAPCIVLGNSCFKHAELMIMVAVPCSGRFSYIFAVSGLHLKQNSFMNLVVSTLYFLTDCCNSTACEEK